MATNNNTSVSTRDCAKYLSTIHVDLGPLGPLLPELRVVNVDIRPVGGHVEAGLGECRALHPRLNVPHMGALLQNVLDVFFTELLAGVVVLHQCAVCTLLQQILHLLLTQLILLQATQSFYSNGGVQAASHVPAHC